MTATGPLDFAIEVVAISASGVLAPGPLFFANLAYGARQGARAGLKVACGHAAVELPLIVMLAAGLLTFSAASGAAGPGYYAGMIGIVGGAAIIGFAAMQVAGVLAKMDKERHHQRQSQRKQNQQGAPPGAQTEPGPLWGRSGPFAAGVALSALNPFFLVWWLTVGLKLVLDGTAAFGPAGGIASLFAFHIWMDYAWLAATAYLASRGRAALVKSRYYDRYYPAMALGLAGVLAYYGVSFVASGIRAVAEGA